MHFTKSSATLADTQRLRSALLKCGVSPVGANEFAEGQVVSSSSDRHQLAHLMMELTEFDMTFRKIELTWNQGGKSANDDWESRS